ncbi:unnamed protein product [Trichogramma brassicae]|uniref:Uncharacterized protein n=1 Tax=Trichogramma brassicae TaxID=86971 RepID=A0A6H5ICC7_9HYME|nr:unnamed protein product [Trichogramma brassicae]
MEITNAPRAFDIDASLSVSHAVGKVLEAHRSWLALAPIRRHELHLRKACGSRQH